MLKPGPDFKEPFAFIPTLSRKTEIFPPAVFSVSEENKGLPWFQVLPATSDPPSPKETAMGKVSSREVPAQSSGQGKETDTQRNELE